MREWYWPEEGVFAFCISDVFQNVTKTLLFSVLSVGFGSSFLYGYNIGVINTPQTVRFWILSKKDGRLGSWFIDRTFVASIDWLIVAICIDGLLVWLLWSPISSHHRLWVSGSAIFSVRDTKDNPLNQHQSHRKKMQQTTSGARSSRRKDARKCLNGIPNST